MLPRALLASSPVQRRKADGWQNPTQPNELATAGLTPEVEKTQVYP